MTPHPEALLAARAANRNGIFTAETAHQCGISDDQIRRRVRDQRLHQVHPGVYRFAGPDMTWRQQVTAAVLTCPELAAASHVTAAFLWKLISLGGREPYDIEVVTRRWHRVHRPYVVHESTDLVESHITELDGIPITTPARTVVDLGASAKSLVGGALDTAIRSGLTSLPDVLATVQQVARKGRRGVGVIRPHIGAQLAMSRMSESYLEGLFERGLSQHGLPRPEQQVPVLRSDNSLISRIDFAYPNVRLGLAIDGYASHGTKDRFQIDRTQQNELELLGWMILRYTWWDVTGRMPHTAQQVRDALRTRRELLLA